VATTVLVVDDNEPFRVVARAVLEDSGYDVVGEAGDGDEAVSVARATTPDVVLLDVLLPGRDGFAVAEDLAELRPAPVVILVSTRDRSAYRRRLVDAAVKGFIPKSELSGQRLAEELGR